MTLNDTLFGRSKGHWKIYRFRSQYFITVISTNTIYIFSVYEEKYFTPPQMVQSINSVLQIFSNYYFFCHAMLSKKFDTTHSEFKKQF